MTYNSIEIARMKIRHKKTPRFPDISAADVRLAIGAHVNMLQKRECLKTRQKWSHLPETKVIF